MGHLYQELENYGNSDFYPFHMPGHKRNRDLAEGRFPFGQDITEIDGFDNLHHPEGILLQVQEEIAAFYHVEESFLSVNGSTAGLLSAVSAAVKRRGKLLVARNCHKAVYHAMYLRELQPVYLYPPMEKTFGMNGGIRKEDVEAALKEHPDIEAVLITSPTYDGVVSDVRGIAEIVHRYGIPLLVDEAHGAHFLYHSYFPESALSLGADVVIQSVHKTLPCMTQTALVHRCSDRVDRSLLTRFLSIYQSSSPSYILMASVDACIERLKREGEELFARYTKNLKKTRECLKTCRNLKLITEEIVGSDGIFDYDRSKILISTQGTPMSGNELSRILREKYHLEMEMESAHYVTALTAVGDTEEGLHRLCQALLEIDETLCSLENEKDSENQKFFDYMILKMEPVWNISDAMEAPYEVCDLEKSEGKISAEFAFFYPPGIPVIVPGERITGQFLENMRRYRECGFILQGLNDFTNRTIRIIRE